MQVVDFYKNYIKKIKNLVDGENSPLLNKIVHLMRHLGNPTFRGKSRRQPKLLI